MTEPSCWYDVTVTIDHNSSSLPGLAEFAAARLAVSCRNVSIMWAHTARQLISIARSRSQTSLGRRASPWLSWPRR